MASSWAEGGEIRCLFSVHDLPGEEAVHLGEGGERRAEV